MNFIKSIDGIDALIYIEKCQKEITQKQLHKKSSNLPKIERFKEARIQLIKELVNWLYVEEYNNKKNFLKNFKKSIDRLLKRC